VSRDTFGASLRTVVSSTMRRRNGLMAWSVVGRSCLEGGGRRNPSISWRDAPSRYDDVGRAQGRGPLPRERFSPM